MALIRFTNGTIADADEVSGNFEHTINDTIITKIDQLIDRDVTRSNDKVSPFVEAYTSAGGMGSSVSFTNNDSFSYDFEKQKYISGNRVKDADTTLSVNDPAFAINASNALDLNLDSFSATRTAGGSGNADLMVEFTTRKIKIVSVLCRNQDGSNTRPIEFFYHNGSSWVSKTTVNVPTSSGIVGRTVVIDEDCSGIMVRRTYNTNGSMDLFQLLILEGGDSQVTHTIPSGTFKDNVSSGVAAVKIADWEDGASLQWKSISNTPLSGISISNPDNFTNPDNAFDFNLSTFARKDSSAAATYTFGRTFNAVSVKRARVFFEQTNTHAAVTQLQTFDGTSWVNLGSSVAGGGGIQVIDVFLSSTIQGLRVSCSTTHSTPRFFNIYSLEVYTSVVVDDTGWKDFNISGDTAYAKISEFDAFTAEPTEFVVKLIPKSVSPLPGVPSISGAGIKLL